MPGILRNEVKKVLKMTADSLCTKFSTHFFAAFFNYETCYCDSGSLFFINLEESRLLKCDALSLDSFEMFQTTHPTTRLLLQQELNLQQHQCMKLKCRLYEPLQ